VSFGLVGYMSQYFLQLLSSLLKFGHSWISNRDKKDIFFG
jgi:hypothetical protein